MLRFVISERDPGVANWLELTGRRRGYVQIRWQRLRRDLTADDGPRVEVVPFDEVGSGCRTTTEARVIARGVAGTDRGPPGRRGGKDAGLMMLRDKVIVVAGVGAGLGRSIALAAAREGADVVLAARTAARLDEVAKEVDGLGRRAVAVPTDLADAAAQERLAEAARNSFGRVDGLVYNALAMPPIKGLGAVPLEALRASFDGNVVAALRLTRLFTPAAGGEPGRGGDGQLDGGAVLPAAGWARTS